VKEIKNVYLYVDSTNLMCPTKIINTSDLRFFPFATGVNDTGGAPLAANISVNF
jgi:hypothetical protein